MSRNSDVIDFIKGGIIVSCQAGEGEPLYGTDMMVRMAASAKLGGACGIRANSVWDVKAIREATGLPVIGIIKKKYPDSDVLITPTIKEFEELYEAGADIIATDLTCRQRPDRRGPEEFFNIIRRLFPDQLILADVSSFDEGIIAEGLGADMVATTLSGYTNYSEVSGEPDIGLVRRLVARLQIPVLAEGRFHYPEQAGQAFDAGAWAVVAGSAITKPIEITKRFCEYRRGKI